MHDQEQQHDHSQTADTTAPGAQSPGAQIRAAADGELAGTPKGSGDAVRFEQTLRTRTASVMAKNHGAPAELRGTIEALLQNAAAPCAGETIRAVADGEAHPPNGTAAVDRDRVRFEQQLRAHVGAVMRDRDAATSAVRTAVVGAMRDTQEPAGNNVLGRIQHDTARNKWASLGIRTASAAAVLLVATTAVITVKHGDKLLPHENLRSGNHPLGAHNGTGAFGAGSGVATVSFQPQQDALRNTLDTVWDNAAGDMAPTPESLPPAQRDAVEEILAAAGIDLENDLNGLPLTGCAQGEVLAGGEPGAGLRTVTLRYGDDPETALTIAVIELKHGIRTGVQPGERSISQDAQGHVRMWSTGDLCFAVRSLNEDSAHSAADALDAPA